MCQTVGSGFAGAAQRDASVGNDQYRDPATEKYFRITDGVGTIIPDDQVVKTVCESNDRYCDQVIELVNQERAKAGLSPVDYDSTLHEAAQTRAEELVELFDYIRPDGSYCATVLKDYGIRCYVAGENIASGQISPEGVMYSWMKSSGHYANIMGEDYTKIGVGCVKYDGVYYWVQIFIGD